MTNTDKSEWRLIDTDLASQLAIMPAGQSHLYLEINEPGSGEVKIPLDSNCADLVASGQFAQANYRGSVRGGFFVDNIGRFEANTEEGGGRWMSISGRGAMALLEDAIVWDDGTVATDRVFTTSTMGLILKTLIDEAQARGSLANLTYDFSATVDSSSVAWTDSDTYSFAVGTSLLDVVRDFVSTGLIEFKMTPSGATFVLSAYNGEMGTDKSETIYFRVGTNCEEVYSDERGDEIKNAYRVSYRDGYISVNDSTSISARRRREEFLNADVAQTTSLAAIIGNAELAQTKDPRKSISVKIWDGVGPRVFVDYDMGDYIMLDVMGTETKYRVLGIQLDWDGDRYSNVVVELNTIFYESQIRQQQRIDRLLNILNKAKNGTNGENIYINQWFSINTDFATYRINDFVIVGGILYVVGDFDTIGGVTAINAAQYNLTTRIWSALGNDGALSTGSALCVAASSTALFIGGNFTNAAGIAAADYVVKYTIATSTYSAMNITDTIAPLTVGISSAVQDIAVSGDHVFMVGNWVYPKDSPLIIDYSIAGNSHVATSASDVAGYGKGNCLAVNAGGTIVYIGGSYNILPAGSTIATYTVATNVIASFYDPDPTYLIKDLYCMTIHDGVLYAAGHNTWDSAASYQTIVKFTLPSATPTIFGSGLTYVYDMVFDPYHHLILGGYFTNANSITGANDIISYSIDSGDWAAAGGASKWAGASVYALIYDGEDLYVGGDDSLTLEGNDSTMGVYITSLPGALELIKQYAATYNHPPVTIGTPANGLSITDAQVLSLALASTSTIGALSDTDWNTFNGKGGGDISGTGVAGQVAEFVTDTKTLQAAKIIGPAVNILTLTNAAAATLALNITVAKTLTLTATDNFALTIPASGTAALLGTANVFTVGGQMVDSTADAIELRLQAHSTKTTKFLTIEKSTGTEMAGFDSTGKVFSYGLAAVITNFFVSGAGSSYATGGNNVGLGINSMLLLTSGTDNLAIGYKSLYSLTSSANNVAIGASALQNLTASQGFNTAIGYQALINLNSALASEARYCVAIGAQAGYSAVTATQNTMIGAFAGKDTTGSANIFLGFGAGWKQTTGASLFIVDNGLRSTAAIEVTNSIIYGVMASTPAAQTLRLNAVTSILQETATTNAVVNAAIVQVESTGTAANGLGAGLLFNLETATAATIQAAGRIYASWITAANATRAGKLSLTAFDTAERLGFEIEASGTAPMLSFYGGTTVVRGAALTTQLTSITHTAPGTPDYAIQDLVDSSGGAAFGFATKDEGNSVLSVILNLQTRVAELEARLGSSTGVNLFA